MRQPQGLPGPASRPMRGRRARRADQDGTSSAPASRSVIRSAIHELSKPLDVGTDPVQAQQRIEEERREFDMNLREYNIVHGFDTIDNRPSHLDKVRGRGRNLGKEIERDGKSRSGISVSSMSAPRPHYSSPAKTYKAAEAAAAELSSLSGDMLRRQQERVHNLITEANRMSAELEKMQAGAGGSRTVRSVGAAARSNQQASSPHVGRQRGNSATLGKNK